MLSFNRRHGNDTSTNANLNRIQKFWTLLIIKFINGNDSYPIQFNSIADATDLTAGPTHATFRLFVRQFTFFRKQLFDHNFYIEWATVREIVDCGQSIWKSYKLANSHFITTAIVRDKNKLFVGENKARPIFVRCDQPCTNSHTHIVCVCVI